MSSSNIVSLMLRKYKPILFMMLIILVFITYYQTTNHEFISYDDEAYILSNSRIKNGINPNSVKWAFTSFEASNWHPITWISHMIDYNMHGLDSYGHHLSNVILHILNAALLFCLLYSTTNKYWGSYFVSAIFALHPLHVESVAWVAERKDLLSTFFMMLTLISYSAFTKRNDKKFYYIAILLFAAGLMSKPMLVTLPIIIILWDYWPLNRFVNDGRSLSTLIREKIPFFILAVLSCAVTYYAQAKGESISSLEATPFLLRVTNAFTSYINYLAKAVWPHNLAIIYPLPDKPPVFQAMVAALSLSTISVLSYRYGKKYPYLRVGWFWYIVTLIPVIGIVQVGLQSMADRYTYMPLTGIIIMIAWGIPALGLRSQHRKIILSILATLVVVTLTILSWVQLRYWQDTISLFRHAAQVTVNNNIALRILGNNYAKLGHVSEAIDCLSQAVKIKPNDAIAHTDLGVAFAEQQKYDEAIFHYTKAIQHNPKLANAYYNLGVALAYKHRYGEAINNYLEALRLDPSKRGARANIGAALLRLGKYYDAVYYLREELRNDPSNEAAKEYLDNLLRVSPSPPQ
jgi:tetratricopeptide (TPR) repeat protein